MRRNHEHGSLHSVSNDSHRSSGHELYPSPASARAAHRAFAEGRRRLYVAREGELEAVSRLVVDEGQSLVVHAASGAGKSSLVASWCHEARLRHADIAVVEHYAVSGAGDRWGLMRHVLLELAELLGCRERCCRESATARSAGAAVTFRAAVIYSRLDTVALVRAPI